MSYEKIVALALNLGFQCYENAPLRNRTTFKIGGPADWFIECRDVTKIGQLLSLIKQENAPLTVIGKGSNLLVSDNGLRGIVLCICDESIKVSGNSVVASAGAKLSSVCKVALENNLSGLEFAFGIPGSVGGAVYMNAGAYGGEIKQVVELVTSITREGKIINRSADKLELGYRTSIFKTNDEIILSAEFKLNYSEKTEIKVLMDDYLNRRKSKQPLDFPSAGSTFKRPEGHFAGALIEQAGLKGTRIGGAEVSPKHAGFIVNCGGATCADVLNLIDLVRERVYKEFGVLLEPEIKIIK